MYPSFLILYSSSIGSGPLRPLPRESVYRSRPRSAAEESSAALKSTLLRAERFVPDGLAPPGAGTDVRESPSPSGPRDASIIAYLIVKINKNLAESEKLVVRYHSSALTHQRYTALERKRTLAAEGLPGGAKKLFCKKGLLLSKKKCLS